MSNLTFREAMNQGLPWYEVSRGGSISSFIPNPNRGGYMDCGSWMDATSKHLNENGNIDIGWGYAVFANAEDAAEVAKRIVTTKYNNSMAKIKKVTNF